MILAVDMVFYVINLSHLRDDQREWELWHKGKVVLTEVQNLCPTTVLTHPAGKDF